MHTYDVEPERLSKPLAGSLLFHVGLFSLIAFAGYLHILSDRNKLGDINAGSPSFGEVTAVNTIPLPRRDARPNPVANDTPVDLPQPKPQPREKPREDPNAIPLKSKREQKKELERERQAREILQKYRQEPLRDNQATTRNGPALSSPMMGVQGNGGVGIANNNPFGYRFGAYAGQLQRLVAAKWQAQGVNIHTSAPAVVTVEIQRDGSFRVLTISNSSGNYAVDTAGRRALLEVGRFPPLPPDFDRSSAVVDFSFRVL